MRLCSDAISNTKKKQSNRPHHSLCQHNNGWPELPEGDPPRLGDLHTKENFLHLHPMAAGRGGKRNGPHSGRLPVKVAPTSSDVATKQSFDVREQYRHYLREQYQPQPLSHSKFRYVNDRNGVVEDWRRIMLRRSARGSAQAGYGGLGAAVTLDRE